MGRGDMQTEVLLNHISSYKIIQNSNHNIAGIAYNSKECRPGFAFVAIIGEKADGHDYIDDAIRNGATTVICQTIPHNYTNYNDITFILVQNVRNALAEISHAFYGFPANKLKIIGITGTNGKTTVTFLLKSIFEAAGKKTGIIGTTGIFIGDKKIETTHTTPESIELCKIFVNMLDAGIEHVIMEVSSHSLALHRVDCINFDIAAFTNLTHEHIDFHKSIENYMLAKKILFDGLSKNSIAIINIDDEHAQNIISDCMAKVVEISRNDRPNAIAVRSEEIENHCSKFVLDFGFGNEKVLFKIKLPAQFNIDNSVLAATIAFHTGIDITAIKIGLLNSKGAPGRFERVNIRTGATAYVDYAHTPDALEKALNACRQHLDSANEVAGKLICVFGCGGNRDKAKRPIMGGIASSIADITIITDDNPRTESSTDIINDIMQGINKKHKPVITIPDRELAIKKAVELSSPNDIVLIAGKGHENYQILGINRIKFDDVEELKNA